MIALISVLLAIAVLVYTLAVRRKDLPAPEPAAGATYLEERKAAVNENLQDLQFEYGVGKLSEADYRAASQELQRELADLERTGEAS
jgi:hypothetical protein